LRVYSLRLRLFFGAAVLCALALGAASAAIVYIFTITVQRDQTEDLGASLDQLAVAVSRADDDVDVTLSDPRYAMPGGGLYYQVESATGSELLRSRSLWDQKLVLPSPPSDEDLLTSVGGPDNQTLSLLVRNITVAGASGEPSALRIGVAENVQLRRHNVQQFAFQIVSALFVVALTLSGACWLMVSLGLRPLSQLREAIEQVTLGKAQRLDEGLPAEFAPVARQVNALLEVQEKTIQLSRERADDLAHGLKTPLAVIKATADRLRSKGDEPNAAGLELLSMEMEDRIDYQLRLAHLRIRSDAQSFASSVDDALIRSVAVIRKTGRGSELYWNLSADKVTGNIDSHDLMELMGVLLENAAKWARSEVQVSCGLLNGRAQFTVSDDGPGIPGQQRENLGVRGHRLDETKSGTGIGLAVAKEIVRLNSGTLHLETSAKGGLSAVVELPLAP
jgi:signal transduction histidine kinase